MAISQNFPNTPPSLLLDFAKSKKLDPRVTFTRGSTGTYVDDNGLIRTVGINEPRFDHDPNTLKSLGLLIEESRTNLILQSTTPDNLVSPWGKGINTTRIGTTTAPDGTNTAVYYSGDGSGGNEFVNQGVNLAANTTYTVSVWAKLISGSVPTSGNIIVAEYNNGSGVVRSNFSFNGNLTAEWKRFSTTYTNVNSGTYNQFFIADQNNTAQIAIWGAQVEVGANATSYIPTVASTVTRSADNANITGTNFSSWYNQTEGTLFTSATYNGTPISGARNRTSASIYGGAGYMWQLWWETGNVGATLLNNGSIFDAVMSSSAISINTSHKLISAFKTNDSAFCQNGGTVVTDTSVTINSGKATLEIGDFLANNALNGRIAQLIYYPRRLTNTQLQNLTR